MLDSKRPGFPLKAIFATLILISWQWAAGQLSNPVFTSRGSLGSEPGIQLLIQNVQNPCGNSVGLGSKKTLFRLRLSGIKSKYSTAGSKYILTLRLRMEDCKGKSIGKNFTIDLARYPKEGEIKNDKDWYVEGARLLSFDGSIQETKLSPSCESKLPGRILSSSDYSIQPGERVRLTAGSDGVLCQNAQWEWLENDCDDLSRIQLDRLPTIVVSPQTTTTYYLRIREMGKTSVCLSKTVYVSEKPLVQKEEPEPEPEPTREPVIVMGAPLDPVCPNTRIRLSVSGGLKSTNNRWVWRKNSCKGDIIGRGSSLEYRPSQSVVLFVIDENDKESECQTVRIVVKEIPSPIDLVINNGKEAVTICQGESATLRISNEKDASAYQIKWLDEQNKNFSENAASVVVSPTRSTKYYVKGEGDCGTVTRTSVIEVKVITRSTAPSSVTETKQQGKTYRFSINGGSLENGASWKWYKGNNCSSGEPIGEGSTILANRKKLTTLAIRAEGGQCGASDCYMHQIVNKKTKTKFGFINVGTLDQKLNNFSITAGSKSIYVRYKTALKKIDVPYEISFSNLNGYTIPTFPIQNGTYYEYNGQRSTIRTSYTGGFMIGGKNIRIYLGGGIGEASSAWGVDIKQYSDPLSKTETWGALQNETFKGIEAEAGLFLRLGFLNLMGGINYIRDKTNGNYIDGTVGIGLTF